MATKTLDSQQMNLYINGEGYVKALVIIYKTYENDPVINDGLTFNDYARMGIEKYRKHIYNQVRAFVKYNFNDILDVKKNPLASLALSCALHCLNPDMALKAGVTLGLFRNNVLNLTTNREALEIGVAMNNFDSFGSFALTEFAHGSNTKGMCATAKYDPATEEFIMNTPGIEAMKCWSGGLGQTATHCLVYAQLYTADDVCHGLHPFIVQVRNMDRVPLPGITVGDMGCKIGYNGTDNGYLLMKDMRIPRVALLNKLGDVTPEGDYITPFKNKSGQFGAVLSSLSGPRIFIAMCSIQNLIMAITIAIRYSFCRKQFGPPGGKELPVIEYQMQQWRLLPHLATAYVWRYYTLWFSTTNILIGMRTEDLKEQVDLVAEGKEVHALSCASKAISGWSAQKAIQEAREACGGHGYLTVNRIGDLRNENDARCTYEGDNNCILMQTSNYLLQCYKKFIDTKTISSPLETLDFMKHIDIIDNLTFSICKADDITPEFIKNALHWVLVFYLKRSYDKLSAQLKLHGCAFTAKNNSQIYHNRSLAIAYVEYVALERFGKDKVFPTDCPTELKTPLLNLYMMHGLTLIEKYLSELYQGHVLNTAESADVIKATILDYCLAIKADALPLVTAVAPPDWVLKSPIGHSNGKQLQNLYDAMVTEESQQRVDWWKEMKVPLQLGSNNHLIKSQL